MFKIKILNLGALLSCILFTSTLVQAKQTVCVFDVQGRSGDIFKGMEEWALASQSARADIKLIPYPKEEEADAAFKAGKCDGVYLTSLRARYYNKFAGSIDALGAVPNITIAEKAIKYALDKRNAKRMISKVNGNTFEVAGIEVVPLV